MDAVAIVTLVGVAVLVAALAAYLITIALILRRVSARLTTIVGALAAIPERTEGIGPAIDSLNLELDKMREALAGLEERHGDEESPSAVERRFG